MPSLLKDSLITAVSRAATVSLALLSSVLVARVLGPSLKGTYSLTVLIAQVASLLLVLGLGSANVYFGARQPRLLPTLAGNSGVAAAGFGLLGVAGVLALTWVPRMQSYLVANGIHPAALRWLVLVLPVMLFTAYAQEILRAAGDLLRYNAVSVLTALTLLAGFVVALGVWHFGLAGAVTAWVTSQGLVAACVAYWVWRRLGGRLAVSLPQLRESLRFGVRLYPGNVAQFLNYRLDLFLVALFLRPLDVGLYSIATGLAERLWEVPHALRTVLLHRVAGTSHTETADAVTARVVRLVAPLAAAGCAGVAAASWLVIDGLYGRAYVPGAPALAVLMPGVWAMSVGKLLAVHLTGRGHPEVGTYAALVSLIVTVVLDLALIPSVGIVGAAIASSVAYALATAVITAFFLRITQLRLADVLLPRSEDLALLGRRLRWPAWPRGAR